MPGLEGFLRFSRRLYSRISGVVFLAHLRCGGVAVGGLPHGSARCRAQDRSILLDHLRACGRFFRLGFLLFLVVVLGAGELVAQGAGAVEGLTGEFTRGPLYQVEYYEDGVAPVDPFAELRKYQQEFARAVAKQETVTGELMESRRMARLAAV